MSNRSDISYFEQTLFGIPFFATSKDDAVLYIKKTVEAGEFLTVATPNPEQIVQQSEDDNFKKALKGFDLFIPDGQGIVWASQLLGKKIQERIPGIDVVGELLKIMSQEKYTGCIVGGRGYEQSDKLQVASCKSIGDGFWQLSIDGANLFWYQDFDRDHPKDGQAVLSWIQEHHPAFVFVALGAPYQEEWVAKHREVLEKAGVRCVMVVGGAFDVIFGKVKRAPEVVQSIGFEWGWRLLQQPWRWKRQLRLAKFGKLVFEQMGK